MLKSHGEKIAAIGPDECRSTVPTKSEWTIQCDPNQKEQQSAHRSLRKEAAPGGSIMH